jgi:hypothetical protein
VARQQQQQQQQQQQPEQQDVLYNPTNWKNNFQVVYYL